MRRWKQAGGNFPIAVNWEQTKEIEGEILERKEVVVNSETRTVMTIETEDGKINVWESAGLRALFALDDGTYVKITCQGMKENPKTRRSFRAFTVEYDEDGDDKEGKDMPDCRNRMEPF